MGQPPGLRLAEPPNWSHGKDLIGTERGPAAGTELESRAKAPEGRRGPTKGTGPVDWKSRGRSRYMFAEPEGTGR